MEEVKGALVAANIPPDVKTVWNTRAFGRRMRRTSGSDKWGMEVRPFS